MNLSNIWQHPKTSIAGVLICITTIAGVLSQQGITLGSAGTGTIVALIGALATSLLGGLAEDPGASSGTRAKLTVIALAFLAAHTRLFFALGLFFLCFGLTACAGGAFLTDLEQVIPTALGGVSGLLGIVGMLAGQPELTAVAAILNPIAKKIQTNLQAANELVAQYKQDGSEDTLAQIESLIPTIQADLNSLPAVDGLPAAQAAQVSAVTNTLVPQLEALLSSLPVFKSSTAGQTLTVTKPASAAAFKAQVAAVIAG